MTVQWVLCACGCYRRGDIESKCWWLAALITDTPVSRCADWGQTIAVNICTGV